MHPAVGERWGLGAHLWLWLRCSSSRSGSVSQACICLHHRGVVGQRVRREVSRREGAVRACGGRSSSSSSSSSRSTAATAEAAAPEQQQQAFYIGGEDNLYVVYSTVCRVYRVIYPTYVCNGLGSRSLELGILYKYSTPLLLYL